MLRLGAHESIAGGLHRAFEHGETAGCAALQIWVKNSRQWSAPALTDEEIHQFQQARERTNIVPVVAHAAYLINIASPDEALYRRSIDALTAEAERCEALDVPYLVLHPGSHMGEGVQVGLKRVAAALGDIHAATPGYRTQILLETTSGQGNVLGSDFESLAYLLAETHAGERLGICLDTCHIFTAGYELRTPEGYAKTMAAFDQTVGLERLKAIHLNDSQYPLGSHKDRHEHIGDGHLGLESFRHILNDARLTGLPGLLETPKSKDLHEDRENLAALQALVRHLPEGKTGIDHHDR
jgi:deoxyribonuclease-4